MAMQRNSKQHSELAAHSMIVSCSWQFGDHTEWILCKIESVMYRWVSLGQDFKSCLIPLSTTLNLGVDDWSALACQKLYDNISKLRVAHLCWTLNRNQYISWYLWRRICVLTWLTLLKKCWRSLSNSGMYTLAGLLLAVASTPFGLEWEISRLLEPLRESIVNCFLRYVASARQLSSPQTYS